MNTEKIGAKMLPQLSIFKVTWPIFGEMLLMMLLGNVDVLMLSQYSDQAVAAIGVSNQLLAMALTLFGFVSIGAAVVSAQYVGAGKVEESKDVAVVSLFTNFLFGLLISAIYVIFRTQFLTFMGIDAELMHWGQTFILIVGGFIFLQALLSVCGALLRSHGFTRDMLFISLAMNVLNVIGNAIVIFGIFGIPVFGVAGVAVVTVISKLFGLFLVIITLQRRIPGVISRFSKLNKGQNNYLNKILKIGMPAASEGLSFNGYQLIVTTMVASLGTAALTTQIYARSINFFIALLASSTGHGGAIIIGQMMGAKKFDEIYKSCFKYLRFGILASSIGGILLFLSYRPILSVFTTDQEVLRIAGYLFFIGIFLEIGRGANMIIVGALRATGDAKFPATIALVSMWILGAGGALFFGIILGWGLPGVLMGSMLDECIRAVIMFFRWRSKAWISKAIIS